MTAPKRYRKKPVEVEAVQWTGENIEAVHEFMAPDKPAYMDGFSNADELLGLPSGVAGKGDWVLHDPETHTFSHLPSDEFQATYEEVADGEGEAIEACVSRCPDCGRYFVDRVGVSRAAGCFNGHETADCEVVATIRGPLARVALDLNLINGIQTDEEWLYDAKERTGAADLSEATGYLAVRALEQLIAVALTQHTTSEGGSSE